MNTQQIKTFLFAGRALFTLQSKKTGKHYTFRALTNDDGTLVWVSLLAAPESTLFHSRFTYMGTAFKTEPLYYVVTRKSDPKHPVQSVLSWFFRVLQRDVLPDDLTFRHAGCCGRCGRELTTPESIDIGLGPVCAEKLCA